MVSQASLRNKNLAIVDDHVPLLKAMAGLLESYGAKVRSYQNGRDFLQEMPPVDCLILDYYMPNMNGLQLAAELQMWIRRANRYFDGNKRRNTRGSGGSDED